MIAAKVTSRPTAAAKTKATKGPSPPGATIIRITETTRTAAQASRNWSFDPLPLGEGQESGSGDRRVGHGTDAQSDGRGPVVVHPCSYTGEREQHHATDGGQNAGQAVHVVPGVGGPQHEGEKDQQDGSAEEPGAAHQAVVPQRAVAGDGGGDGIGDVVEDRRGQRFGEGPQRQELAVEDALGRQGARAVEHGAVATHEVVPDRCTLRGALPGQAEDLRVEVGDGDVFGQCHVDAAVRRDDRDSAETGSAAGRSSGTRVTGSGGRR